MGATQVKTFYVLGALLLLAAGPLLAQVDGTIGINNARQQGTNPSGRIMVNSTDPVQLGSSISHWDPLVFPNLLMEPAINADLPFLGLDISPQQMFDVGWTAGNSTINIFPVNPPGEGFTDPRPFAGAPGNPATTLGEARVNLFNAVLGTWGAILNSPVSIDVVVDWRALPCTQGGGAVLASAGPIAVFAGEPGSEFPFSNTWYHSALAEALVGSDMSGTPAEGGGDIIVNMNSALDEECLGPGTGYYYGLDGNDPANLIDVAPVVLHEIGHGLGFSNFTNEVTGAFLEELPNVYDHFTLDETTGLTWAQMATDAERATSAINVRQVTWAGALANAAAQALLDVGVPELTINAPADIAGTYEIGTAVFGGAIPGGGLSAEIACMTDGIDPFVSGDLSNLNGCLPATNPEEIAGKIALIDRGGCNFTTKVRNAQDAGAVGAIISNIAGNTPPGLGGTDDAVIIPAISVGRRDGARLRKAACGDRAAIVQGDRFQVQVQFTDFDGGEGFGVAHPLTSEGGYFTFFNAENPEIFVKVIDGCGFNENYWFFAAGLTNLQVIMTVIDTQTGALQAFLSPLGSAFSPIQNTLAFPCP